MEIKRDLFLEQRSLEIRWVKPKKDEKVLEKVLENDLRTIVLKWKIRYNVQK